MIYNVLNTQSEAQIKCDIDTAKYFSDLPTEKTIQNENGNDIIIQIDNSKYIEITKYWDCPKQRLDGKWVYAKYENSTQNLTEETYDSSWFPSE